MIKNGAAPALLITAGTLSDMAPQTPSSRQTMAVYHALVTTSEG